MTTEQMEKWQGSFGQEYTDRNTLSVDEMESLYKQLYGITRIELNGRFLDGIDRSARVLEVGANVGNQLLCLQQMGFRNLYGIEPQRYAIERARSRTSQINIIEGSAFELPYSDNFFELVFTSGVLIHLHPSDLSRAMREIYRCAKTYIWGFEYYAPVHTEITYREHGSLLWKADFAQLYLEQFDDLELIHEERLTYLDNDNVDAMFLLRKRL